MAKSDRKSDPKISRRSFARGIAVATATAIVPKSNVATASQASDGKSPLSPEAEAQYQAIIAKYSSRLSDEQKTDLRRLIAQAQKASATLRSYPLDNSDEPAMVFQIYRSDRDKRRR